MPAPRLGVIKEMPAAERRVALTPDAVKKLTTSGAEVLVETGAGAGAWFADDQFSAAGAAVVDRSSLYADADIVVSVGVPDLEAAHPGQTLVGMLQPLLNPTTMARAASRGITAVSLDGLPRTLSRAQGMDALTSQANVAGYKAVLVAAEHFDRYFPLLITAAGTSKPAQVLVLGAGVAGLQAIATARRLGAVVRGYDVRAQSREEVRSLGAQFLDLTAVAGLASEGGYARALTEQEQADQVAELGGHMARHDIVITTAQVPGRRPPLMVSAQAVAGMAPGSVIVDIAASELGGNVEGSSPETTLITDNGVTIVGAGNLPSQMATSASNAYARNVSALLSHLIQEDALVVDLADEITAGVVVTYAGAVVHPATAALLKEL
jgi:H+-translocating NAD(P) transhydrogenase subunit alpha